MPGMRMFPGKREPSHKETKHRHASDHSPDMTPPQRFHGWKGERTKERFARGHRGHTGAEVLAMGHKKQSVYGC